MSQEHDDTSPASGKLNRMTEAAANVWDRTKGASQSLYKTATQQVSHANDQYQNSRAREYVESVLQQTGQGLDTISGKAMYELVKERLDLQDRYNDLLATKLQEALDRIAALETRLTKNEGAPTHGDNG